MAATSGTVAAVHLVTLCGSLGPGSANQAALDLAARHLGDATTSAAHLDDIPAFRPDLVDEPPAAVAQLRSVLDRSDGVLLAAPEYAGGLSGTVKNALDWMVGAATLYRKPVAVLSAGTSGGEHAIEQLVRTLTWQGAYVVARLGIASPAAKRRAGEYVDPPTVEAIADWATQLREAILAPAVERHARASAIVSALGIDPRQLGDP